MGRYSMACQWENTTVSILSSVLKEKLLSCVYAAHQRLYFVGAVSTPSYSPWMSPMLSCYKPCSWPRQLSSNFPALTLILSAYSPLEQLHVPWGVITLIMISRATGSHYSNPMAYGMRWLISRMTKDNIHFFHPQTPLFSFSKSGLHFYCRSRWHQ